MMNAPDEIEVRVLDVPYVIEINGIVYGLWLVPVTASKGPPGIWHLPLDMDVSLSHQRLDEGPITLYDIVSKLTELTEKMEG